MEYSKKEQEAIISVLYNLAHVDYRKHDVESTALDECREVMSFMDKDFVPIQKEELHAKAFPVLKQMSQDKKRAFSLMMTKVSRSDGDFGPRERAFVMEVLEMCDIPFVHKG